MSFQFSVSPDIAPDRLANWFMLNNWLQRHSGTAIHLRLFDDFAAQRQAVAEGALDLVYANPYDAATFVREHGFRALARPSDGADEAIVAVAGESPLHGVEDLRPGMAVALSGEPSVDLMGMILLEPSGVAADDMRIKTCRTYVVVAKALLRREADAGIFLARAFDELAGSTRAALRVLVRGQIDIVAHQWLLGPRMAAVHAQLRDALLGMAADERGAAVLASIGIAGWEAIADEDIEFMIDLIETLRP
jgi:phosphonate transport system substrate-binding protein